MKSYFMFLFVYLSFVFWSSYGSANYLDDQVLKYCKSFATKHFREENLSYKIDSSYLIKLLLKISSISQSHEWYCFVSGKAENHTIRIHGWTASPSDLKGREYAYGQAQKHHMVASTIAVGAIEYISKIERVITRERVTYVSVVEVKSEENTEGFDQRREVLKLQ